MNLMNLIVKSYVLEWILGIAACGLFLLACAVYGVIRLWRHIKKRKNKKGVTK